MLLAALVATAGVAQVVTLVAARPVTANAMPSMEIMMYLIFMFLGCLLFWL
jgi:hypothetical protein